ncbi:MAG: DNA-3-methyladenine glycosylase 2 family protein [Rhodobacteraceae bacterium]|nr:DNA-3-methyladenine glycosylase 2 family protein [Paracoccaceae bacterium]
MRVGMPAGGDAGGAAGRIITSPDCVAEGAAWLAARFPPFAHALAVTGPLPLRRSGDGFPALLDAIVAQQVSTASADAVMARLQAAGLVTPGAILAADEEGLRACGLSRQKTGHVRALAAAGPDFQALREAPDAEVVARLVALPGIGRWTAEIYAIVSLGRADVFAAGDLALREAARDLFALDGRPSEAALRAMAAAWSPWRAVAARALWAYYRVMKGRAVAPARPAGAAGAAPQTGGGERP